MGRAQAASRLRRAIVGDGYTAVIRQIRWGAGACLIAFSVVLLIACGGGGKSDDDPPVATVTTAPMPAVTGTLPPDATPTTLLPTSTAAPLPTSTAAPPTATSDPTVSMALAGVALALDDLPDGFAQLPAELSGDVGGPCGHPDFARKDNKLGEIEVRFQSSDLGPFVLQNLVVFPEADAADAFAYARSSIDCSEWTETGDDGVPTTFRVSPLELAPVGDDSFAVRIELDIEGVGNLVTDTVLIRVGNILSVLGYTTVSSPDLATLAALAETAAEKMAAAELP